ncbi:hypothetical protein [Gracilibacillus boraciitolerans]
MSWKLGTLKWRELFLPRYHDKSALQMYWTKHKKKWLYQPISYYQKQEKAWRHWLYIHQTNIQNLPNYVYLPISSQFLFNCTPPWIWQSRIYMDLILAFDYFTLSQVSHLLQEHYISSDLFPLITTTYHPVQEYLHLLVQLGILKMVEKNGYIVKRTTV